MSDLEFNRPEVVAEVRDAFHAYEAALLVNDLAVLDAAFWADERVVRFAFGHVQVGADAVAAARRAQHRQTGPRRLTDLHVTTAGHDVGVVFAVFRLDEDGGVVHQSQTWARILGGWRIIAAHVSLP